MSKSRSRLKSSCGNAVVLLVLLSSAALAAASSSHLRRALEAPSVERLLQESSNATVCDESCCPSEPNPFAAVPFAVQIILIIILISLSALFSGLTLGIMGLDKTGLEIVMDVSRKKECFVVTRAERRLTCDYSSCRATM